MATPDECRLCDRPAVTTCRLEGRDERGQPDIREFDACKQHDVLIDAGRWPELIATAENKAAAMDLAQLAGRGGLRVESQPKIGQVEPEGLVPPGSCEPEGLEPPGYGRGGGSDHPDRMRREFDWGPRKNVEPEIEREIW